MITLSSLSNSTRQDRKVQRVGRGIGSGRGKTCCRGVKGDKARAGYKRRYGHEGGQMPLYKKLPIRGFLNGRFRQYVTAINLGLIDKLYQDGEIVSVETLMAKNILNRKSAKAFKILSRGKLHKNIQFEDGQFSSSAREELEKRSLIIKK
jgi:large subunit ribosomal protein L15